MIRRRQTQVFSLAFLDCICCGFGAVILVFVLSVDSREKEKLQTLMEVRQLLAEQAARVARLKASQADLERSRARAASQVTEARLRNDSIRGLLDELEGSLQREKRGQEALLVDVDDLKKEIAARQQIPASEVSRQLPLAFLAPSIVTAILEGRQPVELTAKALKRVDLPLDWSEQSRRLGFSNG